MRPHLMFASRGVRLGLFALAAHASVSGQAGAQAVAGQPPGARRSAAVRVVTLESPARDGRTWHYAVVMVPGARLLGATEGTTATSRPLLLTVQLSDALAAGDQVVGTVRFSEGDALVERQLRARISPRRLIEVAAARPLRATQPGQALFIPFTVANRGNATDTLQLTLATPGGWESSLNYAATLVLSAGAQATITARVRPPMTLSAGSGLVTMQATDASSAQGATVLVEVGASRAASLSGPEQVLGIASIRDDAGAMRQAYSFALHGQVTDGLRIDAVLATPLSHDPLALRSASLLGTPTSGSRLRVSGTSGSAEVGRIGIRLPELGGLSLGGDGLAIDWRASDGSQLVAAAARQAGALGAGGTQGAVQWRSRPAPVTVHLGASLLDESQSTGRRLESFTFGARLAPGRAASLSVDLAERRFAGGRGLGMGAEVMWDRPATRGRVRVFHAPGGAAAFAMARDGALFESQLNAGGGWQASGQTWFTSDNSFDGTALRTFGGSLAPSRQVGTHGEVGVTAAFTRYESGAGPTRRDDTEHQITARAAFSAGALRWDAEGGEEFSLRAARFAGRTVQEYATRSVARTAASLSTPVGTFSMRGSFRTASASQASEGSVDVQATDVHPVRAWRALTLEGGVQRVYLGTAGMTSSHAVLGLALPGGLRVLAGAQRDALTALSSAAGSTTYSVRIERTTLARGFARLSQRTGVVFLDLDGDGQRDRGEPALAGVVVRLAGHHATTDGAGRYRLPVEPGTPAIDVRTLADGQQAGTPARADRHDLPVRTTARLEVHLRREEGFGRRTTTSNRVLVTARDSDGKEWLVIADETGRAHFDALPPGAYMVSAASDNADVPLRVEPVAVQIKANATRATSVELVSRARPVRMQGGTAGLGSGVKQ